MKSFKIKIYRKLIDYHNYRARCLKKKIEKLWIKPDCTKCLRNDSPCVPNPWDCSGLVEKKNDWQKNYSVTHKILDILDEYADIITFPSIRVLEKIGGGSNEMEFTVSFKCAEDLKTAEQKFEHEYFKLNKELNKEWY